MKSVNRFISLILLFALSATIIFSPTAKADNNLNIYLFWNQGCPHCAKEKKYLAKILPDYPTVNLSEYETVSSNIKYMEEVGKALGEDINGVPYLIIGDKGIVGFGEGTTDKQIKERIDYCLKNTCPDTVNSIFNKDKDKTTQPKKEDNSKEVVVEKPKVTKKIIKLPIIGEINALDFSLPLLAVFLGVIDGFNPCAMWALLFLISMLLGINNRRRMWVLGVAFIMASAAVYFLFMAAWLNLILFLGLIVWIRYAIGGLAIFGGGHNLISYAKNKDKTGCEVTGSEKRQAVFAKMKSIAQQNSLWLSLGGIILLAFAVNLVELICSAGLPVVFTQVLTMSGLNSWQYYGYILLYIFFFMIDDIIVFAIAMATLKATGISTKYGKLSKLIGGIIMVIIGLLLIFKPGWLMFG